MPFIIVIGNFIFCGALLEAVAVPFLIRKNIASIFVLNSLSVLLLILPVSFLFESSLITDYLRIITPIGMFLFLITLALIINLFLSYKRRINVFTVVLLSSVMLILTLFYPDKSVLFFSVPLLFFSANAIYAVLRSRAVSPGLTAAMISGFAFLIISISISVIYNQVPFLLLSTGLIFVLNSVLFLIYYFSKTSGMLRNIMRSRELHKRLIHKIAMQSQRLMMLKRVIQEKDVELLQMAKHASLAEITAGIAHELTQPLAGIKAIAQNMVDDINYDEFENLQAVSELLKICLMVNKASTIIDHIRNFSKKSSFTMQFVDINKVILNAIDLVNIQLKGYNIEIILVLSEDIENIYGDKIALEQLIINLLLNSRDAIIKKRKVHEEADSNGSIRVVTRKDTASVELIIEDNGIGIPEDKIKNVWSPFFTTKIRSGHTGIGLSISSKIIKEHNGEVSIESEQDSGTKFTIRFPAKKENHVISV